MFEFCIGDKNYTNIYFIGIGGISMSGLAEILLHNGHMIYGSDSKESKVTKRLEKLGAKIKIGQKSNNIDEKFDLIIYTDAISKDNPELIKAKELNLELIDRASFLGAIMKNYKNSIAIAGTHGKTTTTSMLSTILKNSQLDPTILLGGQLKDIGGNVRIGSKDCILTEACEYKGNILKYYPSLAVIMNIDEDHLDYFKSIDHIVDTFKEFVSNLKEEDTLIINGDDPHAQDIIEVANTNIVTFGLEKPSNYEARNISYFSDHSIFDLYIDNKFISDFRVNFIGKHNVYNSLASITSSHFLGLDIREIKNELERYSGVDRRLELKGFLNGVKIIDDYAHHPTEIQVTLKAVQGSKNKNGEVYCVFQPHTFTRTQKLFESFISSFVDADHTIITDIFAAREIDDGSIHSKDLAKALKGTNSIYLETFEDIKDFLLDNIKPDDIVLTMGAGNIYELGEDLLNNKTKAV